jgi:hypothetical protein
VLLTVALGAAACGSASTETSGASTEAPASEPSSTQPESPEAPESGDGASADPNENSTGGDDASDAAVENLFPDVDVVNIADGSTVNLADELGGGDRPVLLWFWAPH